MNKHLARLLFVTALSTALYAQQPSIAGTWTMGIQHDHVIPLALVLKTDGAKVTGVLTLPQGMPGAGDVALEGEFTDGTLKLSTLADYDGPMKMKISGTLKDDGTLGGDVAVGNGSMKWSAERLRTRGKKSATGVWDLTINAPDHNTMHVDLDIKQDSNKLTASAVTPHGESIAFTGEIANGVITLSTPAGGDHPHKITAKIKDDGTLEGTLAAPPMGEMTLTGTRKK